MEFLFQKNWIFGRMTFSSCTLLNFNFGNDEVLQGSQETIKYLNPEQLNVIEGILKTALLQRKRLS